MEWKRFFDREREKAVIEIWTTTALHIQTIYIYFKMWNQLAIKGDFFKWACHLPNP